MLSDLVVSDDVYGPGTEAGGGSGLGSDQVGVELGVPQVLLLHHAEARLGDVLLVVRHQRQQEVIHLATGRRQSGSTKTLGSQTY